MAFLALSLAEIFHSFNMRSRRGSIFLMKTQNIFLWGAMIASFLCTALVIYVPFLADAFGFEYISLMEYLIVIGLSVTVIPMGGADQAHSAGRREKKPIRFERNRRYADH